MLIMMARNWLYRGPRIGQTDERRLSFGVWLTDHDAFHHMNNSRYISVADLAVIDHMMRTGTFQAMRREGMAPVVVHKSISIYRMLRFPQRYHVVSAIVCWTGPYVCFRHRFERKGRLHAEGVTIGRIIGQGSDKPSVDKLIERLDLKDVPESPPIPPDIQLQIDMLEEARARRKAKPEKTEKSDTIAA